MPPTALPARAGDVVEIVGGTEAALGDFPYIVSLHIAARISAVACC